MTNKCREQADIFQQTRRPCTPDEKIFWSMHSFRGRSEHTKHEHAASCEHTLQPLQLHRKNVVLQCMFAGEGPSARRMSKPAPSSRPSAHCSVQSLRIQRLSAPLTPPLHAPQPLPTSTSQGCRIYAQVRRPSLSRGQGFGH